MATYTWSIPSGKEITGSTYLKDTDNYLGDTINDLVDFVNGEGVHLNQGMTYDFVDKATDQTITGKKTYTQDIAGNIDTATKLKTARKINGFAFDGTADITTFTTGMIMLWSGSIVNIPTGWYLCNGANGTPNLVDRFVVGAGSTYAVGATGGSANAVVVSHTHTASADSQGNHSHSGGTGAVSADHGHNFTIGRNFSATKPGSTGFGIGGYGLVSGNGYEDTLGTGGINANHSHDVFLNAAGAHGHNISISTNGESGTNKNLPPYYALCYIMKG